MLETVWAAGSIELFVPIQDVFGWRDRINTPATVTDTTGRGGCRGRSIGWTMCRRRGNPRP